MEHAIEKSPIHLWIVGGLATLWNGFGCFDYLMTRTRGAAYIESMMPTLDGDAMMAYIDSFPIWAALGWGLGVWAGLAGSIFLLLRKSWAVVTLLLSLVGAVLGLGYQIVVAPPLPGAEGLAFEIMPYVIIGVALGLFVYARAMRTKGVLR